MLYCSHPLFVLLELLFEKCEQATQGDEAPTSASFDDDIQEFVRRKEQEMTPLLSENPEIDNLVILITSQLTTMGWSNF